MSRMHNPAHPGEVLREYLPEGVTVTQAAEHLGVTRQAFSALLNGRAGVSADMALRWAPARRCGCRCSLLTSCGKPSTNRAQKSGALPLEVRPAAAGVAQGNLPGARTSDPEYRIAVQYRRNPRGPRFFAGESVENRRWCEYHHK